MNVYRINLFPKPPGSKFEFYAQLSCRKSNESFLRDGNFKGKPFPKPWRRVKLYFDEPLWPRADFYHLGTNNFVCNERARNLTGSVLEESGELLPVSIDGEEENHYIYNVTSCGAFMDPEKSVRKYLEPTKSVLPLVAPAFRPKAIKEQYIFKIPEDSGRTTYCVERTDRSRKREFKALVEDHKLTGLRFEFAWSEKRGPVPWQNPPIAPGMGWITGDGKEFRLK